MKTKSYLFLLAVLIGLMSCNNCIVATGDVKEEERLVNEFSTIELDGSMDVIIRDRLISDKNKVVVKAASNVLPLVKTTVSGSKLNIDLQQCVEGNSSVEVYLYVNEISKIVNDGSGSVRSDNILKSDRFDVLLDGSGSVELKLRSNRVKVNHGGSGRIMLSGNTNSLEVSHDSSGESELSSLQSEEAKVNLDGSGTVSVFATKRLNLNLDGSGTINYKGSPKELKTNKDGSGEIRESK